MIDNQDWFLILLSLLEPLQNWVKNFPKLILLKFRNWPWTWLTHMRNVAEETCWSVCRMGWQVLLPKKEIFSLPFLSFAFIINGRRLSDLSSSQVMASSWLSEVADFLIEKQTCFVLFCFIDPAFYIRDSLLILNSEEDSKFSEGLHIRSWGTDSLLLMYLFFIHFFFDLTNIYWILSMH